MSDQLRNTVDSLLKERVVPVLRELGFKGSYPHFRRTDGEHTDLLMFYFGKYGGAVCCEVSFVGPAGGNLIDVKLAQGRPLTVPFTRERFRLGSIPERGKMDHWFTYDPTSPSRQTSPDEIAERLKELVQTQAEQWWAENRKASSNPHAGL